MPRNPTAIRIEVQLTPEQYQVLLDEAVTAGFVTITPGTLDTKGSVAEFVREHLTWTLPGFAAAKPVTKRGKYTRRNL